MSRQGLKDFVHAMEHSASLRSELQKLDSINAVVNMAKQLGFSVCAADLHDDERCEQVERWFENSWIA